MTFLNADLLSGSTLVMELSNMKDKMKDADIVIVGEGRMDKQSMMGKIPVQIAQEAKNKVASFWLLSAALHSKTT